MGSVQNRSYLREIDPDLIHRSRGPLSTTNLRSDYFAMNDLATGSDQNMHHLGWSRLEFGGEVIWSSECIRIQIYLPSVIRDHALVVRTMTLRTLIL